MADPECSRKPHQCRLKDGAAAPQVVHRPPSLLLPLSPRQMLEAAQRAARIFRHPKEPKIHGQGGAPMRPRLHLHMLKAPLSHQAIARVLKEHLPPTTFMTIVTNQRKMRLDPMLSWRHLLLRQATAVQQLPREQRRLPQWRQQVVTRDLCWSGTFRKMKQA